MKKSQFEELQARWLYGEPLTEEQEAMRKRLAQRDLLTRRELELFEELRRDVIDRTALPTDEAFAEKVLRLSKVVHTPRLRLVKPGESGEALGEPPWAKKPKSENPLLWTRIWRRPFVLLPAAAALCALVAVAVLKLPAQRAASIEHKGDDSTAGPYVPVRAELVLSSGEVSVDGAPADVGAHPLKQGGIVATARGLACLTIEPKIEVCLDKHSKLRLAQLKASDVRLSVVKGSAVARLSKRHLHHTFSLVANGVRATAIGTVFAVAQSRDNAQAQVTVLQGDVSVSVRNNTPVVVAAHNRLRIDANKARSSRSEAVGRGEEATLWAQLSYSHYWQPTELGIANIASDEPGHRVSLSGDEAELLLPLRMFLPRGPHQLTVTSPKGVERVFDIDVQVGHVQALNVSKAAPQTVSPKNADREKQALDRQEMLGPRELLAAARRERQSGNTAAALRLYGRLRAAHPSSREAHTVLVTMGKLELELGRPRRALGYFDTYLKAGGYVGQEALAGKIRSLQALGRTAEERRAVRQYLARYPQGFLAPALRKRLQTIEDP